MPGNTGRQGSEGRIGELRRCIRELEANDQVRGLLRALRDTVIFAVDADGTYVFAWVEPSIERRTGITSEAMVGRNMADFVPPEEAARRLAVVRRVLQTGEPHREVYSIKFPGGVFWHDISIAALRDEDGTSFAALCTVRDVTEKHAVDATGGPSREAQDLGVDGVSTPRRPSASPHLLLAWKPSLVSAADRVPLDGPARIGRGRQAMFPGADPHLSNVQFGLDPNGHGTAIRDLGRTSATFVNGTRLTAPRPLADQDVIRAGREVFVFAPDVLPGELSPGLSPAAHGMAGPFHSAHLLAVIDEAVRTSRHLLIEGESGVGKELVACACHKLACPDKPFVVHNCATFASAEEAKTTMFGVVRGVFTGVETRAGLIERADGGMLYLDEVHNLPLDVQRSLLRFAEDGKYSRFGETTVRAAAVRLLLGSNRAVPAAIVEGRLAGDLVARTHHLAVPSLARRRADIPAIFLAVLGRLATQRRIDMWEPCSDDDADFMEALTLHDYVGTNVRLLEDLAATMCARVERAGRDFWSEAAAQLLVERFGDSPVVQRRHRPAEAPTRRDCGSTYESHREAIVEAYRECGGNLTAIERSLRQRGIVVHRRWLTEFLDRWGVRRRRPAIAAGPALPPGRRGSKPTPGVRK